MLPGTNVLPPATSPVAGKSQDDLSVQRGLRGADLAVESAGANDCGTAVLR